MPNPKVLVANRGEIAIRVFRAAAELGWTTVALYTENDSSHSTYADESIQLSSPAEYMDVQKVVECAIRSKSTHIHPGYGFLSESSELASACAAANITFVGPSPDTIRIASDKLLARELATSLGVPVAPGKRVKSPEDVLALDVGFPVMIKALDGGGGRGIRICEGAEEVGEAFKRCLGESPSRQVFAEKALKGPGWKHVEVQIVGDGREVVHLWERECSVQRRFQKIIEIAPSSLPRTSVQPLIDSAVKMATALKYKGLGTFEFLVNASTKQWVFLEINPRVQVEHTVTEEISNIDLVQTQLLLSLPNNTLSSLSLSSTPPPMGHAIQLRLTAEDPTKSFRLSPGTIRAEDITWPAGRGIRIDTWLSSLQTNTFTVGTDFDSLLAKIIVHGASFEEATRRARRALQELRFRSNVRTNMEVLGGVLEHPDWRDGRVDTLWLEREVEGVLKLGGRKKDSSSTSTTTTASGSTPSASHVTLQPGTIFHLHLSPSSSDQAQEQKQTTHTLTLSSIALNTFPERLSGTLQTSLIPKGSLSFDLSQSQSQSSSSLPLADPNNPTHIASPITGKLVEVCKPGEKVRKGDTIAVLSVMKMESIVSAPRDGVVAAYGGEGVRVGEVVGEGGLLVVLDLEGEGRPGRSRL
ncbi:hypothetical protein V5O48_009306 [Marasmius crinis-equi]|uniref:Pyruvate carboxylase n=1 Tax=Marasmius crinis-equi TaxID=585013 RepID=A0ABR3FBM8_9AGAR